ncbi:MAG: hypothetical protein HY319_19510 [Armatimonadetes bacterium]|nr:hypothetical protein [Armatimonadota bacterium]
MPGVTLKVSSQTRDRIKALAQRSQKSMSAVIDEAMACYERSLREAEYLEGWRRFQEDDPEGFADYMRESQELEQGLLDALPD